MTLPKVNFETKETILESIEQVAREIANNVVLKINDVYYRIIDFEFYVYTHSKVFQDPYSYKGELQRQSNKLYLHYSGVDITFGDDENYGGILIRSIIKLYKDVKQENAFIKQQFEGPQIVAMELFSNIHPLNSGEKNEIALVHAKEYINDLPSTLKIITTKRVGLVIKELDEKEFHNELLRYIIILPKSQGFKQKIKGLENLVNEQLKSGVITPDEAEKILGYKRNFT